MVKIEKWTNAEEMIKYHAAVLAPEQESEERFHRPAFWGRGFELLGISNPEYSAKFFSDLSHNRHPVTQNQLTIRRKKNARVGYDATFSPPKSISVMALVCEDERILALHDAAVVVTLDFLESRALTRVRKEGQVGDRVTGNLLAGWFRHYISRDSDPQLHDHAVIFNATFDQEEKVWKALQASCLYCEQRLASEVYRSALVAGLHKLGYRTVHTAKSFEIDGVPRNVIKTFSKRRATIVKIAKNLGQKDNQKAYRAIAKNSRQEKEAFIPVEKLRKSWLEQLTDEEIECLNTLKAASVVPVEMKQVPTEEALSWAMEHVFERLSVTNRNDLEVEAFRYARGHFDVNQLHAAIEDAVAKGTLIFKNGLYTTPEIVKKERELIAFVNDERDCLPPLNEEFLISGTLGEDQRKAVGFTLLSQDRFTFISGAAGSGKTKALTELVKGLVEKEHNVTILAPSTAAVKTLKADGFQEAITLQRFLKNDALPKKSSGHVIILDEAGLVSLNQMHRLALLAKTHSNRIVLVGEVKQHKSVDAGDSLRILSARSLLRTTTLTEIRRQFHPRYRNAVKHFTDGKPVKGFDEIDSLGWVREICGPCEEKRGPALAAQFAAVLKADKSAQAVATVWREVKEVTIAIRRELRAQSMLGVEEREVSILVPKNSSEAERGAVHLFEAGDVIVFDRNIDTFDHNDYLTVISEFEGKLELQYSDGEPVCFDPAANADSFSVYRWDKLLITEGEHLLLRRNFYSRKKTSSGGKNDLVNGELVVVKRFDDGDIQLEDGRTIPLNYKYFTHGYCLTSYGSQSATVDEVFISVDEDAAHTPASSFESIYVALSRGRDKCTFFTDSKSELREAILYSSERMAGIELIEAED